MDISTGNWFEYLREEVLTEGLRDIGLPEYVVDFIEEAMPKSPEKAKTYAGNGWKKAISTDNLQNLQLTVVNHLIDQYGDYVLMQDSEEDQVTRLQARTVAPYDIERPSEKRQSYDDDMKRRAEQVKFVIQNVKNILAKPMGTWRKAFMKAVKALSKAGIPSEKVESTQEYFKALLLQEFQNWWYRYDLLFAWLNSEPTNYELIKGEESLRHAYEVAQDDLNNREDPAMVIHEFDDGSYWYNLDVSNCAVEGERMGHCGGDSRGTLISLRKKKGKRKASSSYITMTWDGDDTLYQIKGRSNDAPPMETWDHIDWFIKNMGVTSVQESGEHSNDHDGFVEMNQYLQRENPHVSFHGQIDEDAIQEAIDEVINNYEGENSSISGEVYGPNEHGGDAGVYVYMNGYANLQIDLGWKGFRYGDNEFRATLGPDDGTPDERFETIPGNTWGSEARDFVSETEIENFGWDLPGEDGEIEWEVTMLTGAPSDWELGDPEPAPTAHLEITFSSVEQEPVDDEDDAARVAENFATAMTENFEDRYQEIHENIRSKLAQEGYAVKTAFDREQQGMSEMGLDHWKVYRDGPKLEFWFRRSKRQDNAVLNSGGEVGSIPQLVKMWGFDESRDGHIDGIYSRMFGSRPQGHPKRIENDDLSRNMARNLEKLYRAQEAPAPGQQQLALGDEYEAPPPSLVLAKDSRFIMIPETTHQAEQYPTMLLNWKYEIAVDAKSSPEEVETVKKIVKYFNEHPDMVEEAAAETIRTPVESIKALADATKADVMSGKWPEHAIRVIDSQHHAAAMSGSDEWAERRIMIAKWIKENFDQMEEVEKWVAWFKFLSPLKEGRFNIAREGDIEMDDDANIGRPESWRRKVKEQMKKLGAWAGSVRDYSGVQTQEPMAGTLGEPRDLSENIEQQIERVERLLHEQNIDVRLYRMEIRARISADRARNLKQLQDQLRGLPNVTTLSTIESQDNLYGEESLLALKFALVGQKSREQFVVHELLPLINKVPGIQIDPRKDIGWSMPVAVTPGKSLRESTILQEYGFGIGGVASNLGAQRTMSGTEMPTPRPTLQSIVDDWAEGGVMAYDVPTDTRDMRYSVMMPVEELTPFTARYYRGDMGDFEGRYQQFIKNGATAPVYLAIGMNGRVKITGNEDIVWFAKKSGLKEVPVFLSYQKQA